jgi:hypothetical protein
MVRATAALLGAALVAALASAEDVSARMGKRTLVLTSEGVERSHSQFLGQLKGACARVGSGADRPACEA